MIQLHGVTKRFGSVPAVSNISFEMESGRVTGFLGPNGAGKTTTMRMITGYLKPDEGQVLIDGMTHENHGHKLRQKIGYLPEMAPLYADMTVVEYLEMAGGLRGLKGRELKKAMAHMISICGLGKNLKKEIAHLSKGFRQRVGLAQAMIHDPDILILDEPTTGLDPNQIRYIKDLIKTLGKKKSLMLSTHILHQAPEICDRLLIICEGRLVFDGTPQEAVSHLGPPARARLDIEGDDSKLSAFLGRFSFVTGFHKASEQNGFSRYYLNGEFSPFQVADLFDACANQPWRVGALSAEPPSLDEVFARLTKEVGNGDRLVDR